jgi:ATP-dependent protease ClpP protease subunit
MMTIKKPWYEIKARPAMPDAAVKAGAAEIYIYGDIGDSWNENSVTAANFVRDLQLLNASEITLRINSLGGSVGVGWRSTTPSSVIQPGSTCRWMVLRFPVPA